MRQLREFDLAPRGRWVFMTLVLAIVVGSAGGPLPARAAPTVTSIDTWLVARKLKGDQTICVGDKVIIAVNVFKRIGVEGNFLLGRLTGVEVEAFLDGSGVGKINPAKTTTTMASDNINRNRFTFIAEKPGETTVVFQGKVGKKVFLGLEISSGNTVTAAMPLKVENCEYRVSTTSRWVQKGGTFSVVAMITDAGMTMDKPGHYTGDAQVKWYIVPNIELAGCTIGDVSVPNGEAILTGEWADGPDLILDVDFDPVGFEPVKIACPNLPGSPEGTAQSDSKRQPGTLTKRFPASGGYEPMDHSLTGFPSGSVRIYLKRVTGK